MAGHVFLTRGDLTKCHCDAWLLPTDAGFSVRHGFRHGVSDEVRSLLQRLHLRQLRTGEEPPSDWGTGQQRVLGLDGWLDLGGIPRPYLVNVGAWSGMRIDWYVDGVRAFFQAVATDQSTRQPLNRRAKPLVSLPVVGTGHGGAAKLSGDMVKALLPVLYDAAATYDFDVALVTADGPAFAAAQNERRRYLSEEPGGTANAGWSDLDERLRAAATRLGQHAADGSLVLFLGAGVSTGAGLPNWKQLLDDLAQWAGMDGREREALRLIDILDQARIVRSRLEAGTGAAANGKALGEAVARRFMAKRYSLAHSLLACLPVTEVVTTNYDRLFEMASAVAGHDIRVLPYQRAMRKGRWLLKMHGSVDHPDDIVLTREDYLRYVDRRAALFGIVQALLITRHMLFVGFSLSDDNFHRIVDDVRKAVRDTEHPGQSGALFGTALFLHHAPLLEELWRDDLRHVPMTLAPEPAAEAARRLDIFLDYLLAEATRSVSPLLNPAYDAILTTEEKEIADRLRALESGVPEEVRASPAWRRVEAMLAEFRGESL